MIITFGAVLALSASAFAQKKPDKQKAKDPVCGMIVDKDSKLSVQHNGETHYFCSKADIEEFKKNLQKYTKKK